MTDQDVSQIRVDDYSVGIMGLKSALEEMAEPYGQEPDQAVTDALLNRLSQKNYIPPKARTAYGKAFLREFKKYVGKPYEASVPSGIDIKVLGPGCPQCDGLEQELMAVVSQIQIAASIEHVQDMKEIGRWGVMGTPALVINGRVKSVGKIPPRAKLIQWLEEANTKQT